MGRGRFDLIKTSHKHKKRKNKAEWNYPENNFSIMDNFEENGPSLKLFRSRRSNYNIVSDINW